MKDYNERGLHWTWAVLIMALVFTAMTSTVKFSQLDQQVQRIAHRLDLIEHAIGVQR